MKLIRLVPLLAILAALLLLIAGPGTRMDLWEFRFGFQLMRWSLYLAAVAGVIALLLLLIPRTRRGNGLGLVFALFVSLATAAVPLFLYQSAQSVPRIHDITTDTVNPPDFVAVAPLREDAPNPLEYPGEEVARQQREAYPDIVSFETDAYPSIVFEHALAVVDQLGWDLVEADPDRGRIEATETTFWFGFKDDIVIRVLAGNGGTVVDVRSKSRVGMSDVGANAQRIRRFLDALDERVH